jgi:hypothetical protein
MARLPNCYFYVDEFQNVTNEAFENILSESRKYKLCLTIANQYIEQMEEEVRNAVFGNVGSTVIFRVGPMDAQFLEPVFGPTFLPEDMVGLGRGDIYLTLMIDGVGSAPFSAHTLPPVEAPSESYKDDIIYFTRNRYGRPRMPVEKEVNEAGEKWQGAAKEKHKTDSAKGQKGKDGPPPGSTYGTRPRPDAATPAVAAPLKTVFETVIKQPESPAYHRPAAQVQQVAPQPTPQVQSTPVQSQQSWPTLPETHHAKTPADILRTMHHPKPQQSAAPQSVQHDGRSALKDAIASARTAASQQGGRTPRAIHHGGLQAAKEFVNHSSASRPPHTQHQRHAPRPSAPPREEPKLSHSAPPDASQKPNHERNNKEVDPGELHKLLYGDD